MPSHQPGSGNVLGFQVTSIQRRGSGAKRSGRRVAEHRGLRRHKLAWSICAEVPDRRRMLEQLKRNIWILCQIGS